MVWTIINVSHLNEHGDGISHRIGRIVGSDPNARPSTSSSMGDIMSNILNTGSSLYFDKDPDDADTRYSYHLFRSLTLGSVEVALSLATQLASDMASGRCPVDITRFRLWRNTYRDIKLEVSLRHQLDGDRLVTYLRDAYGLTVTRYYAKWGRVPDTAKQSNLLNERAADWYTVRKQCVTASGVDGILKLLDHVPI